MTHTELGSYDVVVVGSGAAGSSAAISSASSTLFAITSILVLFSVMILMTSKFFPQDLFCRVRFPGPSHQISLKDTEQVGHEEVKRQPGCERVGKIS